MTDAEVADFYKKNQSAFYLPPQANATVVVANNEVDAESAKALLKANMRLATIAQQPRLRVVSANGFNVDWRQLGGNAGALLNQAMSGKKKGDIVTIRATNGFFIARIDNIRNGGAPPLDANKAQITRLYRLSKAESEPATLAKLYKDAGVRFEVSRYSSYFADVENFAPKAPQSGKQVAQNH